MTEIEQPGKLRTRARGPKTAVAALAAMLLAGLFASLAYANLVQRGDLFVTFNGGISPTALPRYKDAPIAVSLSGKVRVLPGNQPPSLRQITIELNRAGHLDTTGLPLCRVSQIEATSDSSALAACRPALIGSGRFSAEVAFPEQPIIPSHGTILAFNGREGSHPVILAHIFGTEPLSITRVWSSTYATPPAVTAPNSAANCRPKSSTTATSPRSTSTSTGSSPTGAPPTAISRPPAPPRRLLSRLLPLRPRLDDLRRRPNPLLHPDPQLHGKKMTVIRGTTKLNFIDYHGPRGQSLARAGQPAPGELRENGGDRRLREAGLFGGGCRVPMPKSKRAKRSSFLTVGELPGPRQPCLSDPLPCSATTPKPAWRRPRLSTPLCPLTAVSSRDPQRRRLLELTSTHQTPLEDSCATIFRVTVD